MLAPGSVIGVLGDGQLGRMLLQAASTLGYRGHVFGGQSGSPAAQVCDRLTVGSFDDEGALAAFADSVDVVTLEWENVPVSAVEFLTQRVPVFPGPRALAVCQARDLEKQFANDCDCPTTPWRFATTPDDAVQAAKELGGDVVLKTNRLGYDGRGQVRVGPLDDAGEAFASLGYVPVVVEQFCPFECEISVVVARGQDGQVRAAPPVRNEHRNHILSETHAPAGVSEEVASLATAAALRLACGLEYIGVMAVEFFVTADGRALVNEMAPRPHNSGHWSIDGAHTSQFEQAVRAICGLPLGDPSLLGAVRMVNLLGDEVDRAPELLADGWKVHLYGKSEVRAGRKMGHATRLELE